MEKLDFKKADKALCTGKVGRFDQVHVPEMLFLMVDGQGDPNTDPAYAHAVSALYGLSYAVKFAAKVALGQDHVVGVLEGLWWADDMADFAAEHRDLWRWTMMIRQPLWITQGMLDDAKAKLVGKLAKGNNPTSTAITITAVRLMLFDEGDCLQTLHLGRYVDEAPVIARLHQVELPARGLGPSGRHHEIYLSDPRKVAAEKLKTILRQPVHPLQSGRKPGAPLA